METMDAVPVVVAAAVGGLIGRAKHKNALEYALLGGGAAALGLMLLGHRHGGHHVGQLPQALDPALPGQFTYDLDPRTDPRLDPVSRRQLYPAWLLAHWQSGDRKVIAQIQRMLGVPGDGVPGGGTAIAIRNFQAQNGLQTTGTMDVRTLQALVAG
jgi:peptidoglycan hydrolase-like protein with peptidoglycan-binding domain